MEAESEEVALHLAKSATDLPITCTRVYDTDAEEAVVELQLIGPKGVIEVYPRRGSLAQRKGVQLTLALLRLIC